MGRAEEESPKASPSESEGSEEILYGGIISSRIIGEDSELLSWQRKTAQNRGANVALTFLKNKKYFFHHKIECCFQ